LAGDKVNRRARYKSRSLRSERQQPVAGVEEQDPELLNRLARHDGGQIGDPLSR
jgi:hypothetical protein